MIRKFLLTLALLPILILPLLAQDTHLTQADLNHFRKANRLFQSGKVLFLNKKLDQAEPKLLETLKEWPEYSEASYLLSRIRYYRNDLDGARTYLERAMKDYPAMVELYKRSLLRYQNSVTGRNTGDINLFAFNEEAQMVSAQLEQELMTNRVLPENLAPPAGYFFHQGNIALKGKDFQLAHDSFRITLQKDPQHEDAANNLLGILLLYQRTREAQSLMDELHRRKMTVNPELEKRVQKMIRNSPKPQTGQ